MKVLITGANGFIGRNLAEFLRGKKGYEVLSPSRSELDLLDADAVFRYVKANGIDVIFHGANVGGNRKYAAQDVLDKNLRMFFNIMRCRKFADRVLVCGSGAEYGRRIPLVRVKESDFGARIPADDYGFSKYVMSSVIEETERAVSLRFFGVFGKYEDYEIKFISNAIVKNLLGMPITIQQNVFFDYLYVNDLVRLIEIFLKRKPKHRSYNLATGSRVDILSLAKKINEHSEFKSEIIVENPGLNNEYSADNSRLMKEAGDFRFTPLDESIPALISYYRSILPSVDAERIRQDPYAEKCVLRKG